MVVFVFDGNGYGNDGGGDLCACLLPPSSPPLDRSTFNPTRRQSPISARRLFHRRYTAAPPARDSRLGSLPPRHSVRWIIDHDDDDDDNTRHHNIIIVVTIENVMTNYIVAVTRRPSQSSARRRINASEWPPRHVPRASEDKSSRDLFASESGFLNFDFTIIIINPLLNIP